ncbi:ATP synthase subunit I [Acetobacterium sp.]|jgi:F1F0 ATPase subunit 2|uniref:ATP synthase subunit I n=1 Tax=Acetobacterium sp. TaxID=1872094 RepID=UPI002726DA5E|nr:ATP synthase subunit I [Acetobacterium sp.]MDO9494025.1 ATP synthase subunit I [Acetobacterium sp.]
MVIGFVGGMLLGLVFFGGLYWTVQKIGQVKYPGPLMLISAVGRMVVLLLGIYFLGGNDMKQFLAVLAGVILVKFLIILSVRKKSRSPE